jgi:hypothetical protein
LLAVLTFSEQRQGPWNCTGFNNLKEIGRALQKHGISKDHTHALLKFKLFGRKQQNIANVLDNAHGQSVTEYNHKVTENRETLGRLIDITIYLGIQELAFRGHNENENSFHQGNFRELAKLLSLHNDNFKQFLDESTIFTGLSTTIRNEIIQSINNVILITVAVENGKSMKQRIPPVFLNCQ